MSKVLAYIRASTHKQDLNHQKLEILELMRKNQCKWMTLSRLPYLPKRQVNKDALTKRRIDEMLENLNEADTLIVTELSRLGRSTAEVIGSMA